jgi:hypothetical protein
MAMSAQVSVQLARLSATSAALKLHLQSRILNLEARNRSKNAAFTPHFPQLDKNIDAKSKFDVNKTIELAHIFFVIEMIRSYSRGRENYG